MINKKFLEELYKNTPPPQKIIAVTKNQNIQTIKEAIKNKLFILGENKVQEAEKKFKNTKIRKKIELHLIGHLQSNKTKKAVNLFDVIQTVDSIKIIKKINEEAKKINKTQIIFIQINIGEDPKKFGIKKEKIKEVCLFVNKKKNIKLKGVMVILPQKGTKKQKEKLFKETKKIQEEIKEKYSKTCTETSMGMSGDFKEALKCGATHIRIGTNIFKTN